MFQGRKEPTTDALGMSYLHSQSLRSHTKRTQCLCCFLFMLQIFSSYLVQSATRVTSAGSTGCTRIPNRLHHHSLPRVHIVQLNKVLTLPVWTLSGLVDPLPVHEHNQPLHLVSRYGRHYLPMDGLDESQDTATSSDVIYFLEVAIVIEWLPVMKIKRLTSYGEKQYRYLTPLLPPIERKSCNCLEMCCCS